MNEVVTQDRIKARLVALTEERLTMVNQWLRLDPTSTKQTCVPTYINHPSLLDVLSDVAPRGTSFGGGGGGGSKPAANLVPIDTLRLIEEEAAAWMMYHFRMKPYGVRDNLRRLYRLVHMLGAEDLRQLDIESRAWETRARLATAWDVEPMRPYVVCPGCGKRATLRLMVDPVSAACMECDAAWDSYSINELGDEIQQYLTAHAREDEDTDTPPVLVSLPESPVHA